MMELVAERGFSGVTVRALVQTSEVSTSTFYRNFPNVEECFASTYRTIIQQARKRLLDVNATDRSREELLGAWVRSILDAAAESPQAARLALVDCYDGGPAMLREVEAATAEVERQFVEGPAALPTQLSQGIVAGVEYVVRAKVLEGRERSLPGMAAELTGWAVRVSTLEPGQEAEGKVEGQRPLGWANGRDPGLAAFAAFGGDRGRVLAAVAKLTADGSYWSLTVPRVRREAGVSRKNFDALYPNLDDCFLEAIEAISISAARAAVEEWDRELPWPRRLEDLSARFCEQIAGSRLLAQLGFIDVLAPGSTGLRRRERLLSRVAQLLRAAAPQEQALEQPAVEAAVSAGWRVLEAEIKATKQPPGQPSAALVAGLILASQREFSTDPRVCGNGTGANSRAGESGARAR